MTADKEGFLYPVVESSLCVDCHRCESACPVINSKEASIPEAVYAAINLDESVRLKSSSGGVFSAIAERVILNGGIVFGAAYNEDFIVQHISVDNFEGLSRLRGSKYVQSEIGNCFQEAKKYLDEGKEVLFSGTQCQIAGLKCFLRKDYDNLLTVDVICHGAPSPKIWKDYLDYIVKNKLSAQEVLSSINFRDKVQGWKGYYFCAYGQNKSGTDSYVVLNEKFTANPFMKLFLRNMILRPSCYSCPAKSGRSGSDITLGDYWGMPEQLSYIDDDKGVSLILCNSEKGQKILGNINVKLFDSTFEDALRGNPSISRSVWESPYRKKVWSMYTKHGIGKVIESIDKLKPSFLKRSYSFIRRKLSI